MMTDNIEQGPDAVFWVRNAIRCRILCWFYIWNPFFILSFYSQDIFCFLKFVQKDVKLNFSTYLTQFKFDLAQTLVKNIRSKNAYFNSNFLFFKLKFFEKLGKNQIFENLKIYFFFIFRCLKPLLPQFFITD